MGKDKGNIIILNGVSSSGKTTLAKALQDNLEEHYFWIANDTFCDMCSTKFWGKDWITAINQALTAMMHSIKAFSDIGLNVIVDQVFLNDKTQADILGKCVEVLADYPVYFIRVDCSLEELERREKERGNRRIGQAKSQLPLVHNHEAYDCTINTSEESLKSNVLKIRSLIEKENGSVAFKTLIEKLKSTGSVY